MNEGIGYGNIVENNCGCIATDGRLVVTVAGGGWIAPVDTKG